MFTLTSSAELFTDPKGRLCIAQGNEINMIELSKYSEFLEWLDTEVGEEYPECHKRMTENLCRENPNLAINVPKLLLKRAEWFAHCNMATYDHNADITIDGRLQLERVVCARRGICKDEGVICCPKPRVELSEREKQCVALLCTGMDISEIAITLGLQQSSVETYLKKAMKRTGVNDRSKLVVWAFQHNMITVSI